MNFSERIRPSKWEQIKGQSPSVKLLKSITKKNHNNNDIPIAYLLSGDSGCGKTTLTHLFAKSLNCENLRTDLNPCNKCYPCKSFYGNDLTHCILTNGIDFGSPQQIRLIKRNLGRRALFGNVLVRIIDEAHGMSNKAIESLLNLLENPLNKETWIFITTDETKFKDTFLSRLTRVPLQDLSLKSCVSILQQGAESLSFKLNKRKLEEIAISSCYNVRLALNELEKLALIKN